MKALIKGVLKPSLTRQQLSASNAISKRRQLLLRPMSPGQGTCTVTTSFIIRGRVMNMTAPLQASSRRGLWRMA